MRREAVVVLAAALALGARAGGAPEALSIAAAANLSYVLGSLDEAFGRANPSVRLTASTGASGSLVAQIRNGAPYDVFLSADREFAEALVRAGGADAATLAVFARGRLVLWTVRPGLELGAVAAVVRDPSVRAIAVANPAGAPYGRAARQALARLGLAAAAEPKLVTAENISQATQFVETGSADAGFVSLSAVLSPALRGRGRWIDVPAELYEPLEQVGVATARGASNPAAALYLAFLRGGEARRILGDYGYAVPPEAGAPR